MADDSTATGGNEPQAGSNDQQADDSTSTAGAPQHGGSGDQNGTDGGFELPWGEFVSSLPENVQGRVQGKVEKLDGDLRKVRGEKRALQAQLDALKPKAEAHDRAQQAQQSAEDQAAERERQATQRAEAAVARMVQSEVKALAAEKFADPEDAAAFLDSTQFLSADGEPDTEAIRDALADLLSRKPHLGKSDPKPRPPAPNAAQGASAVTRNIQTTGTDVGREMYAKRRGRKPATA